jgi:hypothetical protein
MIKRQLKSLCQNIFGKLFGDKGYIYSRLFGKLYENGVQLITILRANNLFRTRAPFHDLATNLIQNSR